MPLSDTDVMPSRTTLAPGLTWQRSCRVPGIRSCMRILALSFAVLSAMKEIGALSFDIKDMLFGPWASDGL